MRTIAKATFLAAAAGIVHTHVTYPLTLVALRRLRGERAEPLPSELPELEPEVPLVSLIVAAFDEEEVIGAKVANALASDWPRERLEVIVASDGSSDGTVEAARAAGADVVLELPRGGKMATQNAAAERARGEILAFSDANSTWEPGAVAALVAAFDDPAVGYASGVVSFTTDVAADTEPVAAGEASEEGAYWRLENRIRELESELGGITAGNGAIYAVRREAYVPLPPSRSHDLSFPFLLRKRGWRSVNVADARASEKMVPTMEGEFARKRRMMIGLPDIVLADRMWDPRGYGAMYGYEILSHRLLRYASPFLHVKLLAASLVLSARPCGRGMRPRTGVYRLALGAQIALLALAAIADRLPIRPARLARYYVLTTASIALGFWDRWRQGPPAAWEKSEGTR
ncbi:MAG: glycosyltransferase [Solirubrobacterales bacterium]